MTTYEVKDILDTYGKVDYDYLDQYDKEGLCQRVTILEKNSQRKDGKDFTVKERK